MVIWSIFTAFLDRPFHVFFFVLFSTFDMDKLGKIHHHRWKELLEISKIAWFESDLLKN